ncbi:hypothetical protein PG993_005851 [Apiospora rasikravindrae]|uniref:Uncharacterized protein n=1 Tax=Apiospora rasikravindrae TaxID=990691 RepID=A0ABR1T9Y5_9PEZI
MFKFGIVEPEQCFLAPGHGHIESAGFRYVDVYDGYGAVVGQRPCMRFVPAGTSSDDGTSYQPLRQGAGFDPITTIPEVESESETPHEFADQTQRVDEALVNYRTSHPSVPGRGRRTQSTDATGGSESGSRSSSQVATSAKRSSSMPVEAERSEVKREEESETAEELIEATQEDPGKASAVVVQSPTVTSPKVFTMDPSLPPFYPQKRPGTPSSWAGLVTQDKGKGKEVIAQPPSSLSDIGSRAPTRASSPGAPGTPGTPVHRSATEKTTDLKQRRRGGSASSSQRSRSHAESPLKRSASAHAAPSTPASKENGKEVAATTRSPVKETPREQEGKASTSAATQDVTPSSPALSSDTAATTTAPSTETRSPSVHRLALTEPSEFPALQAIAGPSTPSSAEPERPALRSWASILGHKKKTAQKPQPPQPQQSQQQQQQKPQGAYGAKDKTGIQKPSQGAVTIGRSYAMEPAKPPQPEADTVQVPKTRPAADDNPPLPGTSSTAQSTNDGAAGATATKPIRSYSAALASGGGGSSSKGPVKMPAKTAKSDNIDWPAPPPSWGRRRPSAAEGRK